MKKLLFLISLMFVTTIGATVVPKDQSEKAAKTTKLDPNVKGGQLVDINTGKPVKDLKKKVDTTKVDDTKVDDTKVNTEKTEEETKVENPKYESKVFQFNKDAKEGTQKGNFYIKDSKLPLPTEFKVKDVPNDGGGVLEISWKYHTEYKPESFEVLRRSKDNKFKRVRTLDASTVSYTYIDKDVKERHIYIYKIRVGNKLIEAKNSFNKDKHFNHLEITWRYPSNSLPKEFEILKKDVTNPKKKTEFKKIGTLESEKNVKYSLRDSSLNIKDCIIDSQCENNLNGKTKCVDKECDGSEVDASYAYIVRVKKDGLYNDTSVKEAKAEVAIFNTNKLVMLLAGIFLVFAIVFFIRMARTGKELYIRRIAGLDAVDDAVGRATEMGREIMFVPGITDIDDPQTIAGLTILGRVAKLTAQYKTPLSVPVSRSMVMITGREIVKESYLSAGRPENFQDGMIYYLTDDQFGFAAGVDGIMVREKPATIFLQGAFYAESLILAETGHHIGAIQISGTAAPSQLPFFITACDYTLMGEELYAASAYLSREPQLLGSLRGQDAGKALILVAIIIGIVLETIAFAFDMPHLSIKEYFKLK